MSNYFNSVEKALHKFYGKDVELYESSRKNKKFMVERPDGKWVHFGQKGAGDWHLDRDTLRRERFRTRNKRWAESEKWTPANLSFYVLW